MGDETQTDGSGPHNPRAQDPYETLSETPELLHHAMIRAFVSDARNHDHWRLVHFDVGRSGVRP